VADSFRWLFQGEFYRGPIPGTHHGRLTAIAETGTFIRFLSRFTAVYMRVCAFLRLMLFNGRGIISCTTRTASLTLLNHVIDWRKFSYNQMWRELSLPFLLPTLELFFIRSAVVPRCSRTKQNACFMRFSTSTE